MLEAFGAQVIDTHGHDANGIVMMDIGAHGAGNDVDHIRPFPSPDHRWHGKIRINPECIISAAPGDHFRPGGNDRVIATPANGYLDPGRQHIQLDIRRAHDISGINPLAANDRRILRINQKNIIPAAADDNIIPFASGEDVIGAVAGDCVVGGTADDVFEAEDIEGVRCGTNERIRTRRSIKQ